MEEIIKIAAEAYAYLYPLVVMDITRQQQLWKASASFNSWMHFRRYPKGTFRGVVRPNFDTLYSLAWLDLSIEPVIIEIPDTAGRYYCMPLMDMWTDCFAVPGQRSSGTGTMKFAVVGPHWNGNLPHGITNFRSPTPYVWIITRFQTNGTRDFEAVHKLQDGLQITLLSNWINKKRQQNVLAKIKPTVNMKVPPLLQLRNMSARDFFRYAGELISFHPPHMTDGSILLRMKKIGFVVGKSFDFDSLDLNIQEAISAGVIAANKSMILSKSANIVNKWRVMGIMGVYGNSYIKRAAVAKGGLGAIPPEECIYLTSVDDANEIEPFVGGKDWVIHFDKNKIPPVDAFWSITIYNKQGFPIPNQIKRYCLGSKDDLKYNEDGSLDIFIQHKSPGIMKNSNWLPIPQAGSLSASIRLYAPKPEVLTGEWSPPAICQNMKANL